VIGWPDEVRRIDRVEAQDFYKHHYAPNNAILIVAGDVTVDEVRNDAQAAFGKVPARELVSRATYAEPPRMGETRLDVTSKDAKVPLFMRVYRVPSYAEGSPGQAEALETLAQLMGGDATGLLYRKLVVERHMATSAGASFDGYTRDSGEFSVYAYPRPGVSLVALEHAVDGIIAECAKTAPKTKDLTRAKTQLIASATYRRDSPFAMASAYGQAMTIGLTAFDVRAWPSRIQAVSGDAVAKAARNFLLKREAVSATLTPAP
jgi:zinc protease